MRYDPCMSIFENDITVWDKVKTILAYLFVIFLAFGASWFFGFLDY